MMHSPANHTFDRQIEAALAWWRDAGVDCDFLDEPQAWIPAAQPEHAPQAAEHRPASRTAPAAAAPAEPKALFARAELPQSLEAFTGWWLAEPALDAGRTSGRVPPRGGTGAQLMVLVPQPEREDGETLLSGPQGRLLSGMLMAMGIAPEQAYFASLLPRHTPHADWQAAWAAGLGEVLAHHVALAAPARIVSFCGNILPLPGNDLPNNADTLRRFNHGEGTVPLLPERDLAAFLERPRWKAGFWRRWREVTQ